MLRKKYLLQQVARHWNNLHREAVNALSLEEFKARLNGAPSNLIQWIATLPITKGLELDGL